VLILLQHLVLPLDAASRGRAIVMHVLGKLRLWDVGQLFFIAVAICCLTFFEILLAQINVFLNRLNGEPVGVSVFGIFVIDKNTILAVR